MSAQQLDSASKGYREAEVMPVTPLCLADLRCCMAQWQQATAAAPRLSWPSWDWDGVWMRQGHTRVTGQVPGTLAHQKLELM